MKAIDARGCFFLTKARMTQNLCWAVFSTTRWTTVDRDADGAPSRQVAEIDFAREEWRASGLRVRVIAVRSKDRPNGKQIYPWEADDYTVQVFLTNDFDADLDELAHRYNGRAGIEPLIAELKGAYGIGKVPSAGFSANHAALLLKVLVRKPPAPLRRGRSPATLVLACSVAAPSSPRCPRPTRPRRPGTPPPPPATAGACAARMKPAPGKRGWGKGGRVGSCKLIIDNYASMPPILSPRTVDTSRIETLAKSTLKLVVSSTLIPRRSLR